MLPLEVIPAIHVSGGKAVRLVRSAPGKTTETGLVAVGDAIEIAAMWSTQGAGWIQIFDLDAANLTGNNRDIVSEIARHVSARISLSGGIRDEQALSEALATGAARITLGTAALHDPEWALEVTHRFPYSVAIALDAYGHETKTGWKVDSSVLDAVAKFDQVGGRVFVVRCMASDGMLTGPNYELLGAICARTRAGVIAAGGIASLEDLRRLRGLVPIGVMGAIVGSAFSLGRFTLQQALAISAGERPLRSALSPDLGLE